MFAWICSLQTELLLCKVVVTILDENKVPPTHVVKDCLVEIEGRALEADLIVFSLILG